MTATDSHTSTARYLWIWVWLAGLMLLGVALSELSLIPLSPGAVVWTVLALSTVKALLVAMYYMHLKFEHRLVLVVAAFPIVVIALAVALVWSAKLVRL